MHASEQRLAVEGLTTTFDLDGRSVQAVAGVSFELGKGERLAIVGESGSGKSITALSILGLVPPPGRVVAGRVLLDGEPLLGLPEPALEKIRGGRIAMIFQDAQSSLNPVRTIGSQLREALRLRNKMSRQAAQAKAAELLERVGLADAGLRLSQYPHQLSGGTNQRVMIAMALAGEPDVLIADEPTTALDATTEAGILRLLDVLAETEGLSVLMISHDLGAVAAFADRVLIMYAGQIMEEGPVDAIMLRPTHPYTRGLLAAVPGQTGRGVVPTMPGAVPDLANVPSGCVFHPRCAVMQGRSRCTDERPSLQVIDGSPNLSACWFAGENAPARKLAAGVPARAHATRDGSEILRVENLYKDFRIGRSLIGGLGGTTRAVEDVTLSIRRGETLALVGESGSGKSTMARMMLGLERPTAGKVTFDDKDITRLRGKSLRRVHRNLQSVSQSPHDALDPKMKLADVITEPLEAHGIGTRRERLQRAQDLLERVGLQASDHTRYPYELSGGQKQRISIARALASDPSLIVCDEPVTALDVSVQAQILNLLYVLQQERGTAYLLIAHDLSVVRQTAHHVAVMYRGRIVEHAPTEDLFRQPRHPYTVALLSARHSLDPGVERARQRVVLPEAPPSQLAPRTGCVFSARCAHAQDICLTVRPELTTLGGAEVACHFPRTELKHAPESSTPVGVK